MIKQTKNILIFLILSFLLVEKLFCIPNILKNENEALYLSVLDKNKIIGLMKQNISESYCQNEFLIESLSSFPYRNYPVFLIPSLGFFAVEKTDYFMKLNEKQNLDSKAIKLIKKYATEGSTVLEIGANIGINTLILSKAVRDPGKVLAFESDLKLFNNLFMNLAINNVKNTKIFLTTFSNLDLNENTTFSLDKIHIDSMKLENVSLVKINSENINETIFDSMKETLEKHRPVILLKISNLDNLKNEDQNPKNQLLLIKEKLKNMNFTLKNIQENDYIAYPDEPKKINKKVLLAILARNKANVLQAYLKCIDSLDYDKKLIGIYINTNNNTDNTKQILKEWANKNKNNYRFIYYDNSELNQNLSSKNDLDEDFKLIGKIRNKSLKKTKEFDCDYYFVVDCDNFISSSTLKCLIKKDKPIIAPMLISVPIKNDPYSNFFYSISESGYYVDNPEYHKILNKSIIGTFKVPVVHGTYLIKASYIDKLNYIDDTNHHPFIVFSRFARTNNIEQYICNEKQFGYLLHFDEKSLHFEFDKQGLPSIQLIP